MLAAEGAGWLAAVGVPVRLVAGTADGAVDLAFLRLLAARYGHLSLEVWEGVRHDAPLVDPARCMAEVERFRAELTVGAVGGRRRWRG